MRQQLNTATVRGAGRRNQQRGGGRRNQRQGGNFTQGYIQQPQAQVRVFINKTKIICFLYKRLIMNSSYIETGDLGMLVWMLRPLEQCSIKKNLMVSFDGRLILNLPLPPLRIKG